MRAIASTLHHGAGGENARKRSRRLLRGAALLPLLAVLSGCNGSSGDNPPDDSGPDGKTILVSQTIEPSGLNCPEGGLAVNAGPDLDGSGVLEPGEITSTQYVCNGADGMDGLHALVAVTDEPAGANCSAGGKQISLGLDRDSNGTLNPEEVTSTDYVCNGQSGADGISTLLLIEDEPAGANCPSGGSKVSAGLDTNLNGALDPAEVGSTAYVCNGATGAPGPGVTWLEITDTAVQAVANTGYLANHATEQVVITLPTAMSVGEVVQVMGSGYGGWRIAQNAGQSIVTRGLGGPAGNDQYRLLR